MFDSPRFCERKELTRILGIFPVYREVAMMHLINHQVCRRLSNWALVAAPMFWRGLTEVNDSTSFAIYTHSFSKYTWCLTLTHIEGVVLAHQVTLDRYTPHIRLTSTFHSYGLDGLATYTFFIYTYLYALGLAWSKEPEGGLLRRILHLIESEIGYLRLKGRHCHNQKQD